MKKVSGKQLKNLRQGFDKLRLEGVFLELLEAVEKHEIHRYSKSGLK